MLVNIFLPLWIFGYFNPITADWIFSTSTSIRSAA